MQALKQDFKMWKPQKISFLMAGACSLEFTDQRIIRTHNGHARKKRWELCKLEENNVNMKKTKVDARVKRNEVGISELWMHKNDRAKWDKRCQKYWPNCLPIALQVLCTVEITNRISGVAVLAPTNEVRLRLVRRLFCRRRDTQMGVL